MAENTNTEREAFESALKSLAAKHGETLEARDFGRESSGEYENGATEIAWMLWQARASMPLPAAGQEPVAYAMFADGGSIRLWSQKPLAHPAAPLYTAPPPQAVREPLSTIDLMRVVMEADNETRGFASRGTTNWAAHIGKAVQNAAHGITKGGQHG